MTTSTVGADIANRIAAAFNAADIDLVAACYAPDATQQHPFFPGGNHGVDAIRTAEGGMIAAFSDIDFQVRQTIEQGDWVAIEIVVSATNTADIPMATGGTIPATGKRVTAEMCSCVRLDGDGLIAEERRYMDVAGFLGQLGLMG